MNRQLKTWILTFFTSLASMTHAADSIPTTSTCGWWSNPEAEQVSYIDNTREWLIKNGDYFESDGHWPDFSSSSQEWATTNTKGFGYGCACLTFTSDKVRGDILYIVKATPQPLNVCRKEDVLIKKEPQNPKARKPTKIKG